MPTLPLGGSASQYGTVEYTLSKNIVAALETVSVHVVVKPKFKGTAIAVWFRELSGTDDYGTYTRKMATINSGSTYTTDLVVTFPYSSILPRGKELRFYFQVGSDADGNFGESTDWEYTGFTVLQARIDPVINSVALTDLRALNPLGYFGAYVQGQSMPRITGNVTLDPLDPTLTAVHTLTLTSGGTTIYSGSNATGIFDPGAISATGTIDWTYTATDSAGNSASQTGNFTVLPYTAPVITTLRAERYKVVLDDHGDPTYPAADDGELVRFTVSADVSSVAGKNAWTLVIGYGVVGDEGTDTVIPLSGTDGGADTIRKIEDRTLLTATIPANADYQFAVAVYDYLNATVKTDYAYKASALFNIEKFGVAVGMRSTGTAENPKLESVYPIVALGGFGRTLTEATGDLNAINAGGIYAITAARKHAPVDAQGMLYVDLPGSEWIVQTFIPIATPGVRYIRTFDGDAWTAWSRYDAAASVSGIGTASRPAAAMTSNSSQNCVASASSVYSSSYPAYKAFDKSGSSGWASSSSSSTAWIQLQMDVALYNIAVTITNRSDNVHGPVSGAVLGSADGTTWAEIGTFTSRDGATGGAETTVACANAGTAYAYVRLRVDTWEETSYCAIGEVMIAGDTLP